MTRRRHLLSHVYERVKEDDEYKALVVVVGLLLYIICILVILILFEPRPAVRDLDSSRDVV